ncbi:MAG: HNH endonuclease [Sulfurimonas sp.]|nr:HNH endonuclease [Sulfurimonas sp.]
MIYVQKNSSIPSSLARQTSYSGEDVTEQLNSDFHGKCYICEQKESITTYHVEHFVPHRGDVALKYDWNNLFLSCGHCNSVKTARQFDDILNCSDKSHQVEKSIRHYCNPFPREVAVFEVKIPSIKANNTRDLLDKTFNGEHTGFKKLESANLRALLLKEIEDFSDAIEGFEEDVDEKEYYKNKIIQHLNSNSAFTAFKRWIIRDNTKLIGEFGYFI